MPVFAYTGHLAAAGALQLRTEGDGRSDSIRGKVQPMQVLCSLFLGTSLVTFSTQSALQNNK